jgi:hypothetical protein
MDTTPFTFSRPPRRIFIPRILFLVLLAALLCKRLIMVFDVL